MNSLKVAIGIALSTVGVGSGVAFGVSNFVGNSESSVKADASGYVLTVNTRTDYDLVKTDSKYQILGLELSGGDYFIINDKEDSYKFFGWSYLDGGTAESNFDEYVNDAILCGVDGKYNIYFEANSSEKITIDFALESEATVYVQLQDGTTTLYVYDEVSDLQNKYEPLGGWPGLTLASASGSANFNQAGGIAKVTFPIVNAENTKVIVKNQYKNQTGNLDLVDGGYYYNDAGMGIKDLGDAAEVVIEIVEEINNATNSSICNISSARAGELYSLYDELNATAKAAVNNSTLWTYKSSDMSQGKADISFVDIANRLSLLSNKGSSSNFILPLSKNEYGTTLLVSIISLLSVSIIVFFFIRRKRHQ